MSELDPAIASRLKRDPAGLVPAVVQEETSGEVLMVAWMNDEALHRTLTTGRATYFSSSISWLAKLDCASRRADSSWAAN